MFSVRNISRLIDKREEVKIGEKVYHLLRCKLGNAPLGLGSLWGQGCVYAFKLDVEFQTHICNPDPNYILQLIPLAQSLIEWIVKLIQGLYPQSPVAKKKEVAMAYVSKVLPSLPSDLASDIIDATVAVYKQAATAGFTPDSDLDKGK